MRTQAFSRSATPLRTPRFFWEEGELEVIGSEDTRRCIRNTTSSPFRFICQIDRPSPSPCSGTLIGPRTVLTAGHCLDDGHAQMRIVPGRNDAATVKEPFGSARAAEVVFAPGFVATTPTDYGVVILREPIGNTVGWWTFDRFMRSGDPLGTSILSNDSLLPTPSFQLDIAGYPCDLPAEKHLGGRRDPCFPSGAAKGTVLYHDRNGIANADFLTTGILEYFNDTYPCMSGSPVWLASPSQGRMLLAVHVSGDAPGGAVANRGVLITGSVREFVRAHSFSPAGTVPPGRPLVRFGARGTAVRELQYRLNIFLLTTPAAGQPRLTIDGIFGSKTLAATRAFQRAMGLAVDGVVGPQTWQRLQLPF